MYAITLSIFILCSYIQNILYYISKCIFPRSNCPYYSNNFKRFNGKWDTIFNHFVTGKSFNIKIINIFVNELILECMKHKISMIHDHISYL